MPILRDRPYGNFNFLVDLGTGQTDGPEAGFSEVSIPETRLEVIEYRNGNDKENALHKITGVERCGNVTLRRGLIGSRALYDWFNDTRNGNVTALRNIRIQLQSEDRKSVVMTWRLLRARPAAIGWGTLQAKGESLALEAFEIAYERMEIE